MTAAAVIGAQVVNFMANKGESSCCTSVAVCQAPPDGICESTCGTLTFVATIGTTTCWVGCWPQHANCDNVGSGGTIPTPVVGAT